jgi:hypothetical protein
MQAILDTIRIIYTLVVTLVVGVEGTGGGTEKRAAVVTQTLAILDEPGGIEVPAWLRAMLPVVLPILVDLIVAQLNRLGFLQASSAS